MSYDEKAEFSSLTHDLEAAEDYLDKLPQGGLWTVERLDRLDELRSAASKLVRMAEVTIEEFTGQQKRPAKRRKK